MPNVIGYAYDADTHCVGCTHLKLTQGALRGTLSDGGFAEESDEHGIPADAIGREGNLLWPIFSTDEARGEHCGDCRERLLP